MQPTYLDFTDFDLEKSDYVKVVPFKRIITKLHGRLALPFRLVVTSMTTIVFTSDSLGKGKSFRRFSAQFGISSSHIRSKYTLVTSVE